MASNTKNIQLQVISLNIGASDTLAGLPAILELENPDIVMLQEVHCSTDALNTVLKKYRYKGFCNNCPQDERTLGTAFVWKSHLPVNNINCIELCRLQSCEIYGQTLFNIYAPSGQVAKNDRRTFFGETVFTAIRGATDGKFPIIGGDFNCILQDIDSTSNQVNKKCQALYDLVSTFELSDAFQTLHPGTAEFTWFRPNYSPARLDRFYVPQFLINNVSDVTHHASLSDHCFVKMVFELTVTGGLQQAQISAKQCYWKLNKSILEDKDFLLNFEDVWTNLLKEEENFQDIATWWDEYAKPKICLFCKNYSSMLAKVKRDTKAFLFYCLHNSILENSWEEVSYYKNRIKKILQKEAYGFVIRSRHKQTLEEERASLYHANREKKLGAKQLTKLRIKENGVSKIEQDRQNIETKIGQFFQPLFSGYHATGPEGQDPIDTGQTFVPDESFDNFFLDGLDKLSEESKEDIEKPIDYEELKNIIFECCAKNKSPGSDGLLYEFYMKTFHIIGEKLVQVFNCILDRILLTTSMKEGLIRLLSKVFDIPWVHQLRPITLLCNDYKLLTKIFVQRLLPVLPEVIRSTQLCGIDDKNILFGVFDFLSTVEYVNLREIAAAIISLDMYKAFDRVYIPWLVKTMKAMGFGTKFVSWIVMCHDGITARFILDTLSDPVKLLFSIRQGDPMASVLYVIYIEPLIRRLNKDVKGVQISNFKQASEAYMDDINTVVESEEDIVKVYDIVKKFEKVSGAILNRSPNKCKIMGLGQWIDKCDYPLPWMTVVDELKISGIEIHQSYQKTLVRNWQGLCKAFKGCLNSWYSRILPTLQMRSDVIKNFATSKLWYKAQILPIPNNYLKMIESAIRIFLWKGKLEYLALDEVKQKPEQGGLSIPCVFSQGHALMVKQCCRVLYNKTHNPYMHFKYWLGQLLQDFLPEMANGPHSPVIPEYFRFIVNLVREAIQDELVDPKDFRMCSAKTLYQEFTTTFPPPKCVYKYDGMPWSIVFKNLQNPVLDSKTKDLMFTIIHNILPNRQRLFKMNKIQDEFCQNKNCLIFRDTDGPLPENVISRDDMTIVIGGHTQDNVHLFCECDKVKEIWAWVRNKVCQMLLVERQNLSNLELIHLAIPSNSNTNEIVWLIANYCYYIYTQVVTRKRRPSITTFQGTLKCLFYENLYANKPELNLWSFDLF